MANYDVESHIQKNVLFFVFGTLCSYDPPWRGFFAWRQKTASLKLVQTRQLWVRPWAVLNRWLCRHHKRKKKNGPGATPGIFIFIVFVLIIRINYSIQWFFSAEAILFQVYVIVVGNAPYGKRHVSRTKPVYGKLNILDQSLHSPQPFLYRCHISSMHSSTRKTPQKRTLKYHSAIYWSPWKTYEFSRHRCCLALDFGDNGNHLYSHRFKPLLEPCVP